MTRHVVLNAARDTGAQSAPSADYDAVRLRELTAALIPKTISFDARYNASSPGQGAVRALLDLADGVANAMDPRSAGRGDTQQLLRNREAAVGRARMELFAATAFSGTVDLDALVHASTTRCDGHGALRRTSYQDGGEPDPLVVESLFAHVGKLSAEVSLQLRISSVGPSVVIDVPLSTGFWNAIELAPGRVRLTSGRVDGSTAIEFQVRHPSMWTMAEITDIISPLIESTLGCKEPFGRAVLNSPILKYLGAARGLKCSVVENLFLTNVDVADFLASLSGARLVDCRFEDVSCCNVKTSLTLSNCQVRGINATNSCLDLTLRDGSDLGDPRNTWGAELRLDVGLEERVGGDASRTSLSVAGELSDTLETHRENSVLVGEIRRQIEGVSDQKKEIKRLIQCTEEPVLKRFARNGRRPLVTIASLMSDRRSLEARGGHTEELRLELASKELELSRQRRETARMGALAQIVSAFRGLIYDPVRAECLAAVPAAPHRVKDEMKRPTNSSAESVKASARPGVRIREYTNNFKISADRYSVSISKSAAGSEPMTQVVLTPSDTQGDEVPQRFTINSRHVDVLVGTLSPTASSSVIKARLLQLEKDALIPIRKIDDDTYLSQVGGSSSDDVTVEWFEAP